MRPLGYLLGGCTALFVATAVGVLSADGGSAIIDSKAGKRLFDNETFGGNGRTCVTCHSHGTGTVSPQDAQARYAADPNDPLFVHDGSDDGAGHGVTRMLNDATIRIQLSLPPNVSLAGDPSARSVVVTRGIPTTLNTPALDPVLMLDGRQPNLEAQALGAMHDHAQAVSFPTTSQLQELVAFEKSKSFFSSAALERYARDGVAPTLPAGKTESEIRGRRLFEDIVDPADPKAGLCAACHAGPMLNETGVNGETLGIPRHTRFISIGVSELNAAHNPVRHYVFTNGDNTTTDVFSPDPGLALVTGRAEHANAFKTPSLWGAAKTAPYFHDNSAKTLEDVMNHYALFFEFVSDPDGPGPLPPFITLTAQDKADAIAYLKLLR